MNKSDINNQLSNLEKKLSDITNKFNIYIQGNGNSQKVKELSKKFAEVTQQKK
jgi:hypothetical protein